MFPVWGNASPSMRTAYRSLLFAFVAALGVVGVSFQPVAAHNSLVSSTPTDGAVLAVAPTQISMLFASSVPLDTASLQVIDAAGARTDITELVHGPGGDTEVVAALPALSDGVVTFRWRLVGPDGHPLSGRISITISTADVPAEVTPTTAVAGTTTPSADQGDAEFAIPAAYRWLLRFGSYLAIVTLIGIMLTDRFVWRGVASGPTLQRLISRSLGVVAALSVLHLLVVASDISGRAPWASIGSIDAAMQTDAGIAFVMRVFLVVVMWLVLRMELAQADVRWTALAFSGLLLMATWAWSGHAKSQRWAEIGVPLDVLHHTAAALWVGALAIVGFSAGRQLPADRLVVVASRLARVAPIAVAVVVATGIVQAIRLVGSPAQLLDATHGRYLLLKLAIVAMMLGLANANRRRVNANFARADRPKRAAVQALRTSVLVEFAVGIAIVGVTSAMVVAPPSSSSAPRAPTTECMFPVITTTLCRNTPL